MPPATALAPDATPLPPRGPSASFMLSHPAHLLALGFGCGLARLAPGTWATLWAWLAFGAMERWLTPTQIGQVILLSLPLGWWACTVTAANLRSPDPASIVWDEIVCFWIVLWLLAPASLAVQAAAFLLFRLLDAFKPGPMAWADRRFKGIGWRGGFGILADDLAAAFCTLFALALWKTWA